MRNKNLNLKKKKTSKLVQHSKKTNAKKRTKRQSRRNCKKNKKFQEIQRKSCVLNMLEIQKVDMFKHQSQQLETILKQPLNSSTLTQEELNMLFMKYKTDGHYRTSKNLPPFTSLLDNTHGQSDEKDFSCNHMQSVFIPDVEIMDNRSNMDEFENFYSNADEENQRTNFMYDSWRPKDIFKTNNMYTESNTLIEDNFNRATNYNIHTRNDVNVLDNYENVAPSKLNLNVNNAAEIEETHFSCNLMNVQNTFSSIGEYQRFRYTNTALVYNRSDSSIQYENLLRDEVSQKNDICYSIQCNDLSVNDQGDGNNESSINKNNNIDTWDNMQLVCIPYANNLESAFPYQSTLITNHMEDENSIGALNHINNYPSMTNDNLTPNTHNVQQNFNTFNSVSSTFFSEKTNYFSEIDTHIPSHANFLNHSI